MQMNVVTGNPFDSEAFSPVLHVLFEDDPQEKAFELAFENEETGMTHRFACDADGVPLSSSREFVRAVDTLRFVGMFSRGE